MRIRDRTWLIAIALVVVAAPQGLAKDAPPSCGDATVVDFFLPGKFEEARKRSRKTGRCLLVKGVAFGMDKAGAACATRGHW